jgi:hypothetical protein
VTAAKSRISSHLSPSSHLPASCTIRTRPKRLSRAPCSLKGRQSQRRHGRPAPSRQTLGSALRRTSRSISTSPSLQGPFLTPSIHTASTSPHHAGPQQPVVICCPAPCRTPNPGAALLLPCPPTSSPATRRLISQMSCHSGRPRAKLSPSCPPAARLLGTDLPQSSMSGSRSPQPMPTAILKDIPSTRPSPRRQHRRQARQTLRR